MRRNLTLAALLFGALWLAAPALADNGGLTPVEPHSPNVERINETYYFVLVVIGVVFVVVEAALLYFVVRYRRGRRAATAEGPQIHGHTRLELLWTAVPVLLLALIVTYSLYKLPGINDPPAANAATGGEPLRVEVLGRQFYWEFRYPDGAVTYDTLVVPVGRVVEVDVSAPDHDVVHAWWVPALAPKRDAVPGLANRTWFRADREGEYEGQCTEFCGVLHAAMISNVRAVAPERWEEELRAARRNQGRQTFEAVCAKCHNVEGPQLIGPTLRGNPALADREALEQLVRNGRNEMPAVGRGWSDDQIDALFRYVRNIGGGGDGG